MDFTFVMQSVKLLATFVNAINSMENVLYEQKIPTKSFEMVHSQKIPYLLATYI